MQATIKALIYGLPILKIKIYTLDGLTVFSTDPKQIGEIKTTPLLVRLLNCPSSYKMEHMAA